MPVHMSGGAAGDRAETVRETGVSCLINAVLSAFFYAVAFGLRTAPSPTDFAADFGVQSAAVAFMGSLVPALLVTRRRRAPGAGRTLVAAIAMAVVAVGAGLVLGRLLLSTGHSPASPTAAIAIKVGWGVAISVIVTPIAVRMVQRRGRAVPL